MCVTLSARRTYEEESFVENEIIRDARCFRVGEEINPQNYLIRLMITAVYPERNTLEARVIKAEGAFSETRRIPGCPQDGFQVGMELVFIPIHPGTWNPKEKSGPSLALPWFTLSIQGNGQKTFLHYR